MKAKAGAYAGYGNAGVRNINNFNYFFYCVPFVNEERILKLWCFPFKVCAMVSEALPLIAAEVAAPLSRVEEIVIIGGNQGIF